MKKSVLKTFAEPYKLIIYFLILSVLFNIIYIYLTRFKKTIIVDEKFTYGGKTTDRTISDTEGNIYKVKNSIYYLYWNSAEIFDKLDKNNKFEIEGYGKRIPIFGMYPNIIKANKV